VRQLQRTWIAGGIALIACGVIGMLRYSLLGTPGAGQILGVTADIVYALGVAVLAIGLTREASVVARRPLGLIAMLVVAIWTLFSALATGWVAGADPQGQGRAWTIFGYVSLVVPTAAALIAATQIARAGVVPAPWKWAPLWVLALNVIAWVVPQLTFAAMSGGDVQLYAGLFAMLGTLAFLASTLGLGTLALVLAARRRPASVDVFRSAP
jgi:hypothetical protein